MCHNIHQSYESGLKQSCCWLKAGQLPPLWPHLACPAVVRAAGEPWGCPSHWPGLPAAGNASSPAHPWSETRSSVLHRLHRCCHPPRADAFELLPFDWAGEGWPCRGCITALLGETWKGQAGLCGPGGGGQGHRGPGAFPLDPASEGLDLRRSGGGCRSEPARAAGANESDWAFTTRALLGERGGIHLARDSQREFVKGLASLVRRL